MDFAVRWATMKLALGIVAACAVAFAACGGEPVSDPTPTPEEYAIEGSLSLADGGWAYFGGPGAGTCEGKGGYSDIGSRTQIVVKDGSNNTLATGSLAVGKVASLNCRFTFTVNVPRAEFYSVESGRHGGLTYTFEDLQEQDWKVFLTLGD